MLQTGVAILFYFIFIFYLFLGVYVLAMDPRSTLNRVFLGLCLSLAVWSLGLALENTETNAGNVLLWWRLSALGWCTTFSLVLHFVLLLTEETTFLKPRKNLFFLYLPALVSLVIFSFNGDLAGEQLQLIQTPWGWGDLPKNNFWDILYNFYYLGYSTITVYLLLKWQKKCAQQEKLRHSLKLFQTFVAAMILGSLTETVINTYLNTKVPSFAPVIILLPAITFSWFIRKYGLMRPLRKISDTPQDSILNAREHQQLIRLIAYFYFLVGGLSVLLFNHDSGTLQDSFFFGGILILMGALIYLLPVTGLTEQQQDGVLTFMIALTGGLVIFQYLHSEISNVIWGLPIACLLISVVFNQVNMYLILSVLTILIGILIWALEPATLLQIQGGEYLARLELTLIVAFLAAYVNRRYVAKIRENDAQINYQQMLADMSTDFITVSGTNLDEKIDQLLAASSALIHAQRAYLGIFRKDYQEIEMTHRFNDPELSPQIPLYESPQHHFSEDNPRLLALPWSREQLLNNELIFFPDPESLPEGAATEQAYFEKFGIQAQVKVPVYSKNRIIGFLAYEQTRKSRIAAEIWEKPEMEKLRILANILGDSLAKVSTENEKNRLAYYDALTGLPNRTLFYNRLDQAIELAKRLEKNVGVIFIDIDGFKEINDTEGHDWGDQLLLEISRRLQSCIRQYDTVARFGGDEFLILVPQIESSRKISDLEQIGDKIMGIFREDIGLSGKNFFISASGGVAVYPDDGQNSHDLIRHADLAMYDAKKRGKSQIAFCSGFMKDALKQRMSLTNALHTALPRQELFLHYQPQVAVDTSTVIGFEALLRWQHPTMGLISPGVFIPLAEQVGIIGDMGEWVLNTACAQNKAWQDQGYTPVKMAVNLSAEQFKSGDLVEMVKKCLKSSGLAPQYLELEITESIAMVKSPRMTNTLNALKAMGVSISLDDFGTEFSSMARLKDLPVDRLKIDMAFVRGIGQNSKDESMISVMILLSKRLGLKVIAEGAETREQLDFLIQAGCPEVQGYYYYKPLSREAIETTPGILTKADSDLE
jgi:diguanylate cyclase (GGDEF)-like protein